MLPPASEESAAREQGQYGLVFRALSPEIPVDLTLHRLLRQPRLFRFVGVHYVKHRERTAHDIHVRVNTMFDCLFHLDQTSALHAWPFPIDSMSPLQALGDIDANGREAP